MNRRFSAILTNENAAKVAAAIESIISRPCTTVEIVGNLNHVNVRTSLTASPLRSGKLVEVDQEGSSFAIRWSIDSSLWPIYASRSYNPVSVALHNDVLTIRHNAPAGHPLVWIYAAEKEDIGLRRQRDALASALRVYADDDECSCCDGSPDQSGSSTSCAYCRAQHVLTGGAGHGE